MRRQGGFAMIETCEAGDALSREIELLDRVSRDPDQRFLWIWQAPQSLVAPRKLSTLPMYTDAARELSADGWPVSLRSTGGDVTPQGPGIVNVTHVYSGRPATSFDLAENYGLLCLPIEQALGQGASRGWQPGAFCDGAYNVQWNGLKFAGTAMRFRQCRADKSRYAVLAHALMLFEPPSTAAITAINRFLGRLGEARQIDPTAHTGLPDGVSPDDFLNRLHHAFAALDLPRPIRN
jgi:lipoate-protein ligase A